MKKIIFLSVLILLTASYSYSQLSGASLIFNSNQYGIFKFTSIKKINSGQKDLYIQHGVNYADTPNLSGKCYKLNKNNFSWYIPANGFLNGAWGIEYPYGSWTCCPVSFFTISPIDTNLIIKFQITPAASCPDAKTLYTTNGGSNYSYAPFSCGGVLIFPNGGDYNPKRNSSLIFGYGNYPVQGIFYSLNSGNNWQNICQISNLRQIQEQWVQYGYGFLKYNPFDTTYLYVNGNDNVLLSTNNGNNFTSLNVKWMKGIIFSYKDSIIYGFNDYKFYHSYNKGLSWDSVQTNIKFTSLEINPDLPNILYGGDSNGVYRSTNYGASWYLYNNTFTPSKLIIGISKDAGSGDTFYVATTKSVYKVWASFLVNAENQNKSLPLNFSLSQNYPNPFNPTTTINFKVKSYQVIRLVVYDILGKEVAVLVNEKLHPGEYKTTFDGSGLASGVYFYSLFADGNLIETKKMLMIK